MLLLCACLAQGAWAQMKIIGPGFTADPNGFRSDEPLPSPQQKVAPGAIIKDCPECPEMVVRSTFIAGFPGETEAEFDDLLAFVREAQIDRAGCFAYSAVDGAQANQLDGMLPIELREERRARFMEVAEQVSTEKLKNRVGANMQVLVDSAPGLGKKGGMGRSYADAPEIDGVVRLLPPQKASKTMKTGEFTRARVVGTQGHDLVAMPV